MIGILNIKLDMKKNILNKKSIFSLLIIVFLSCTNKVKLEQQFIEENFLKIVDTLPYDTGTFVALEKDTIKFSELALHFSQKIDYNKKIDEITTGFFEDNKQLKSIFQSVLEHGTNSEYFLDSNFPKKIGKYRIYFNENQIDKKIKFAGRIDIENLKIYNDKAILILSESVQRFGTTYIVFLVKEKGEWRVLERKVLYQS